MLTPGGRFPTNTFFDEEVVDDDEEEEKVGG